LSYNNSIGTVTLDNDFAPAGTTLTSTNFTSTYNTGLLLGRSVWNTDLDMSAIGDGRAFLASGNGTEVQYLGVTLAAGAGSTYRLAGGAGGTLTFGGADNVLSGANLVQLGSERSNVLSTASGTNSVTNLGGTVRIRNSNSYTGGTFVTKGMTLELETGAAPGGSTPLGSANGLLNGGQTDVEVYGIVQLSANPQGYNGQASFLNAATGANANNFILRPGGQIIINDQLGQVAGGEGRWDDSGALDLNGGLFRFNGVTGNQSVETIGNVTVRKFGTLQVVRTGSGSATLNVGNLTRADRGTLGIVTSAAGTLGIPGSTNTNFFDRVTTTSTQTLSGTTNNGAGVVNGGMVAPWMIDATTVSFMGYNAGNNTFGTDTGFQPLLSTGAPTAGTIEYSHRINNADFTTGITGGTAIADVFTTGTTLGVGDNPNLYALRMSVNINADTAGNTLTLASGGLIMTGNATTIMGNTLTGPQAALPSMTLAFGAAEGVIFNTGTGNIINSRISGSNGLTKFGSGALTINSVGNSLTGQVTVNQGTLTLRSGVFGSTTSSVVNGQNIHLTGNNATLVLDGGVANNSGTYSLLASDYRATTNSGSNVTVTGDSTLQVANIAVATVARQTINNLTFANPGPALGTNSTITLQLGHGIEVLGTTTLIPGAVITMHDAGNRYQTGSTLTGQVIGDGPLVKYSNVGMHLTLASGTNIYTGGTVIHGGAQGQINVISSSARTGTPFSTGDITVYQGGALRIQELSNIASNAVTLNSDNVGVSGISIGYSRGALPTIITTGTPTAGQIKLNTTHDQGFTGFLGLDAASYYGEIDMSTLGDGYMFLGNTAINVPYVNTPYGSHNYLNATLTPGAGNTYRFGGGSGDLLNIGGSIFDNVITGTANVEVGWGIGQLGPNGGSTIGLSGNVGSSTRQNTTGSVRVNPGGTFQLGSSFSIGNGTFIFNGGTLASFGLYGVKNAMQATGNLNFSNGNQLVLRGNVDLSPDGVGATRILNIDGSSRVWFNGVISGADGSNVIKTGAAEWVINADNTYQGTTAITAGNVWFSRDVLPNVAGSFGVSATPILYNVATADRGLLPAGQITIGRDLIFNNNNTADTRLFLQTQTPWNVVMTGNGGLVEVQGTAEGVPFSRAQMDQLMDLASAGIRQLVARQKAALESA
jgi:autotransporter-associated beta strand protein